MPSSSSASNRSSRGAQQVHGPARHAGEARAKAGTAIRADLRAKIEDVPEAEQKGALCRRSRPSSLAVPVAGHPRAGAWWVVDGGKPRGIDVRVGLSDGAMTEVSGDGVAEGLRGDRRPAGRQHHGAGAKGRAARMSSDGAIETVAEPLIRVEQLTKDYALGDTVVHALAGVTLSIGAGEFVAVMGPSGSASRRS